MAKSKSNAENDHINHARKADADALKLLKTIEGMNRAPMEKYLGENPPTIAIVAALAFVAIKAEHSSRAKNAANARHNKPGGSRDKQGKIRLIWASGKYTTRDICAEQECAALDMSFSAARRSLRNTPDPS